MIKTEIILEEIDKNIQHELDKRMLHRKRAIKAIYWFNSMCLPSNLNTFYGNYINYLNQNCICIRADLKYPLAYFTLSPIDSSVDIGSGTGNSFDVKF